MVVRFLPGPVLARDMTPASDYGNLYRPRKRLFIAVLCGACALVLLVAFLLWWVPSVGLVNIHPALPIVFGTILGFAVLLVVGGLGLLILTLLTGRDLFFSERLRGIVIKYLFPGDHRPRPPLRPRSRHAATVVHRPEQPAGPCPPPAGSGGPGLDPAAALYPAVRLRDQDHR